MSAGLTRIIEVCFVAPRYTQDLADSDGHSEHTLDGSREDPQAGAPSPARAFRHLPPFVSHPRLPCVCAPLTPSRSSSSPRGEY